MSHREHRVSTEGQRKTEAVELKAHQCPGGYKWRQIRPLTKIKTAFLFLKYFSPDSGSFKRGDKEGKMGSDQWCHYCGCSGFSHSEQSAETSTQHLLQSSKERVNWYELTEKREHKHVTWFEGWYWYSNSPYFVPKNTQQQATVINTELLHSHRIFISTFKLLNHNTGDQECDQTK